MPCTPATRKLLERRLATLVASAPPARRSPSSESGPTDKPQRAPPATSPRAPRAKRRSTSASVSKAPPKPVVIVYSDAPNSDAGLFSDDDTDEPKVGFPLICKAVTRHSCSFSPRQPTCIVRPPAKSACFIIVLGSSVTSCSCFPHNHSSTDIAPVLIFCCFTPQPTLPLPSRRNLWSTRLSREMRITVMERCCAHSCSSQSSSCLSLSFSQVRTTRQLVLNWCTPRTIVQ